MTNKNHYILQEDIKDEAILNRLIHRYEDQHTYIKKKLLLYQTFMQYIQAEFASSLVRINAEQTPKDIQRNFIEAIEMSF